MPCILMSFAHCILAGSLSCLEDLGGIMGMGFITSLVSLCTYGKTCLMMIYTVGNGLCIPMSFAYCILSGGWSCLEVCLGIKGMVSITSLADICTSECVRVGVEGIPNRSSVPQTRYPWFMRLPLCLPLCLLSNRFFWCVLYACMSGAHGTLQGAGDHQIRQFLDHRVPLDTGVPGRVRSLNPRRQIVSISSWSHSLPLVETLTTKYHVPLHLNALSVASFWNIISEQPSSIFLTGLITIQTDMLAVSRTSRIVLGTVFFQTLYTVTFCLSLTKIRAMWTAGRRQQQEAHRLCRSISPSMEEAFSKRGAARFPQTLQIFDLRISTSVWV